MNELKSLEELIGYSFKNKDYLTLALSHSSYVNELVNQKRQCNERIEFLGDAVLELVSSSYLYKSMPTEKEGELSKRRAALVCEKSLAVVARRIELGQFILLGKGERMNGGAERDSILSDALEAVIGAIYLDGGFGEAEKFVLNFVLDGTEGEFIDYKTRLQELIQALHKDAVVYELVSEDGPEHDRRFTVNVRIDGEIYGVGVGHNKKAAEMMAAKEAIRGNYVLKEH